jgi:hypothetical protein
MDNPNFDPDNSLYDRESDENFDLGEEVEDEDDYEESGEADEEESY